MGSLALPLAMYNNALEGDVLIRARTQGFPARGRAETVKKSLGLPGKWRPKHTRKDLIDVSLSFDRLPFNLSGISGELFEYFESAVDSLIKYARLTAMTNLCRRHSTAARWEHLGARMWFITMESDKQISSRLARSSRVAVSRPCLLSEFTPDMALLTDTFNSRGFSLTRELTIFNISPWPLGSVFLIPLCQCQWVKYLHPPEFHHVHYYRSEPDMKVWLLWLFSFLCTTVTQNPRKGKNRKDKSKRQKQSTPQVDFSHLSCQHHKAVVTGLSLVDGLTRSGLDFFM